MSTSEMQKQQHIERLFASIAPRYDLLNSLLSFNRHKCWRRFAVRQCDLWPGDTALDVCVGTGDFAIELARAVGKHGRVVGVDLCRPMLDLGLKKIRWQRIHNVCLSEGNAQTLPVPSNSFRAATIGFALRNVVNVENTLSEMVRAVEPGGRVVSLELARPRWPVFRSMYNLYFYRLLPLIGWAIHGRREPYAYLPASLATFHSREELSRIMAKVGLADVKVFDLTGGIVSVHVGVKK